MKQTLKIFSAAKLAQHSARLKNLRIEDMEATRPEDKDEILAGIPDTAAFNAHLQTMLFSELFPSWASLDAAQQNQYIGHIIRWHKIGLNSGQVEQGTDENNLEHEEA